MREKGVSRKGSGVFCIECGSDLTVTGGLTFLSCWAGLNRSGCNFKCTGCGAIISKVYDREKEVRHDRN